MKAKRADQALQEAVARHQAGQQAEAEKLYRSVLELKPRTHLALHNLGVIALDKGEIDRAIRLIGKSVQIRPDYPAGHANLALALTSANRTDEAIASFKRAIRLAPTDGDTRFNFGNLLKAQGQFDEAEACYRQALLTNPNDVGVSSALAEVLIALDRPDDAVAVCRRAVAMTPRSVQAHISLGTALRKALDPEGAESSYRAALALAPDDHVARINLARFLIDRNRVEEALPICEALIRDVPGNANVHETMGSALLVKKREEEALACYERALAIDPASRTAHTGRRTALLFMNRQEEALEYLRSSLAADPSQYLDWNELGRMLQASGQLQEAVLAYGKSIKLKPDDPVAILDLGTTFLTLRRSREAKVCYRRGLQIDDENIEGLCGYGHSQGLEGDYKSAIESFEKIELLKPEHTTAQLVHYRQKACLWDGIDTLVEKAIDASKKGAGGVTPFNMLSLSTSLEDLQRVAEQGSAQTVKTVPRLPPCPPPVTREKLRIGYLSGDFHSHPVTRLIAEMLEHHDHNRFEFTAYAYDPHVDDPLRQRVRTAFDHFTDIYLLSFAEAAERIRDDGIDILVDLTGHTLFSRSVIAAYRPAPIQVSYLGFPGTMGADFIDYVIADPYLAPMEHQPFFTEKIVHLPDTYQPSDRKRRAAPTSRAAEHLPEDGIVFAAFNNSNKITPAIFNIWMKLLREAPGSVLWLLADSPFTEANLRREAQARGIGGERLVFAERVKFEEYLGRLALADLFLDCYPYNAGASANDALWMGLPVLTCSGETYVSRMAGSLLTTLGLPELVTHSLAEYETRALELIRDPGRLAALRTKLAERRETSALFDTPRYTRHLEAAYTQMWDIHAAGALPRPFAVQP